MRMVGVVAVKVAVSVALLTEMRLMAIRYGSDTPRVCLLKPGKSQDQAHRRHE
jgi:hypothetical protein